MPLRRGQTYLNAIAMQSVGFLRTARGLYVLWKYYITDTQDEETHREDKQKREFRIFSTAHGIC